MQNCKGQCALPSTKKINKNLSLKTKLIETYNSLYPIFDSSVHFLNACNLYYTFFSTYFFSHLLSVATDDHVQFERNVVILDSIIVKKFVAVYPHTGNYHLSIRKDSSSDVHFFLFLLFKIPDC